MSSTLELAINLEKTFQDGRVPGLTLISIKYPYTGACNQPVSNLTKPELDYSSINNAVTDTDRKHITAMVAGYYLR